MWGLVSESLHKVENQRQDRVIFGKRHTRARTNIPQGYNTPTPQYILTLTHPRQ